jgi:pimeloyl-ACP methyl ester carboxylesterase
MHAQGLAPQPYSLRTASGEVAAELLRVSVPERHAKPDGPKIELAVVRWAAARPTRPPVLFLAGGPGQSGIQGVRAPGIAEVIARAHETSDILLLDQRGTGASKPSLTCPLSSPLGDDFFMSAETMRAALEPNVVSCLTTWRGRGVDLGAYNTSESADDVADVAAAVGAARLSLLAFSYGTHLAAAVVRRHPDVLDRVVFAGFEGPDDTLKLPSVYDTQVAHVAALVASQPDVAGEMPDFAATLERVLARAAREPFRITVGAGDGARQAPIGKDGLLYILRRDIGDSNDLPRLPKLVAELDRGETTLLAQYAVKRFRQFSGVSLMSLAVDCADGASPARQAAVRAEEPGSIFGAMTNPLTGGCERLLGVAALPDSERHPLRTRVPSLFVSGTLDSNTPPFQAERARWGFFDSAHVIVADAGHESTLTVPEVQAAVAAFLRGEAVESRTVKGTPLVFAPVR